MSNIKLGRFKIYKGKTGTRVYWMDKDNVGYRYWIIYKWGIKYMGHLPF